MSLRRIIGIVLIVIGLTGVLWGGFSWTREKKVLDIGPLEAHTRERQTLPISPVIGGVLLVSGVLLVIVPDRRRI
jgi:uncharacterized membrane protein YidH (DUF202 family)